MVAIAPGQGYEGLYAYPTSYTVPGPVPSAGASTFMLAVDWDGDLDLSDANEVLNADVLDFQTQRGRDYASQLTGRAGAGTLQATLLNDDGKYSSFNAASPIFGQILPGRRVGLWITTPVSVCLWTGLLDHIDPQAGDVPTATLNASGVFIKLSGPNSKVDPAPQANVRTSDILEEVLDAAGWPVADRSIDDGAMVIGRWYAEQSEALGLLRDMEEAEGGFIYEGLNWDFVSENRYKRELENATSMATFSDDPPETLQYLLNLVQSDPLREIFNEVSASVSPHRLGAEATLWELSETFVLQAGESRTYFAEVGSIEIEQVVYVDPWTALEIGRDGTVSSGFALNPTGTTTANLGDVSVAATAFSKSLKIVITNVDSVLHTVTALSVDGVPVLASDTFRLSVEDAGSVAKYGRRAYPFASPWFPNSAYAQASIDHVLETYKDPRPILALTIPSSSSTALLEQAAARAISDRVTVEATKMLTMLGINAGFYIESIGHSWAAPGPLETTFMLSPADAAVSFFLVGVSLLGGADGLAY